MNDKKMIIEKITTDFKELVMFICPIVHESEILDNELGKILNKHLPDTQEPDVLEMLEALVNDERIMSIEPPVEVEQKYRINLRKMRNIVCDTLPDAIRQAYEAWKKVQR